MTIRVSVNGKHLFDWKGSAADVTGLDKWVRGAARKFRWSAVEQFVDAVLANVLDRGGLDPHDALVEGPIIAWKLLSQPTDHHGHPGFYRDYIEDLDFGFDISRDDRPKLLRVRVKVYGRTHDQWKRLN
jgi:hypothetical protein